MNKTIEQRATEWRKSINGSMEHEFGYEQGATDQRAIDYSDEAIDTLEYILADYAVAAITCGMAAHGGDPMPTKYADDAIMVEYYNSIKSGVSADDLRPTTMPRWIRKQLGL